MDLNDKKRELEVLKKELKAMEEERKKNPNNASFNLQVNLKRGRVNKLTGEIAILDKMDELERKYKNKGGLYFHYKDNSVFNKVLCEFGSDNYEKAYFQQRKLLELELNYYLAMPINGIKYGKPGYDDLYVQSRNILFDLKSYENSNVSKEEDIKPRPRHFKDEDLVLDNSKVKSGKHFKGAEVKEENYIPYIGAKHFKVNELSFPYTVFVKDGICYIVGNFTSDYLNKNYKLLDSKLLNNNLKNVKLINNLDYGTNKVYGLDVKINVSKDGNIDIVGNVDDVEAHNKVLDDNSNDFEEVNGSVDKDLSGLDVIPDMPDLVNSNSEVESMPTIKGRLIKRKESKPSIIEKFKKFNISRKVAIVAAMIAITGVGLFAANSQIVNGINNFVSADNINMANNTFNTVDDTTDKVSTETMLNYGSIGEGHQVFTNAYDTVNNVNGVTSNEWFNNNPIDVFNTATNSYMGLTQEQLNDSSFMAELAKDSNNVLLLGDSMKSPSGFVKLSDVVSEVSKSGLIK